jgi:hypothetical protein
MATARPTVHGYFAELWLIMLSAALASGAVFGLFNSFLEKLVPPFEDSTQTTAFCSFGTAVMLLGLSLLIHKKLSQVSARIVALGCIVLLTGAVVLFFHFRDVTRTYVYRYPPSSVASSSQTLNVRGELHEQGRQYVQNKSIAQAVSELGGPDYVNGKGLLWSEAARLAAIDRMERLYVYLTMTLTTAFFSVGLAVWKFRER